MALKRSVNYIALRGGPVDDMELYDEHKDDGLLEEYLYTHKLNEWMLGKVKQENMDAGMSVEDAESSRLAALKNIKELYAKNGMLDLMKQS
jgi:hypothetical protein